MIKKDWRFKKNQTIKCFQNFLFGLNWKIVHTRVLKVHLISKTLSIEPNKKLPFCAAKPYKPDYTVVTARAPVSHLLLLLPTKCHMLLPQHQVKEMNHRRSGRSFFFFVVFGFTFLVCTFTLPHSTYFACSLFCLVS